MFNRFSGGIFFQQRTPLFQDPPIEYKDTNLEFGLIIHAQGRISYYFILI